MNQKILKRFAHIALLGIAVICLYHFYQRHQKSKYVEYIAVVDDAATNYTNELSYFFFSVDEKQDVSIGSITLMMPRFGAFGGVYSQESNPSYLETCRRYTDHENPTRVALTKNNTDYNRPENVSDRRLFLKNPSCGFFIAHMKLEETTTANDVRDVRRWKITPIMTKSERKYIFRACDLEKSETLSSESPYAGTLDKVVRLHESKGWTVPRTYSTGASKSQIKN